MLDVSLARIGRALSIEPPQRPSQPCLLRPVAGLLSCGAIVGEVGPARKRASARALVHPMRAIGVEQLQGSATATHKCRRSNFQPRAHATRTACSAATAGCTENQVLSS